MIVEKFIIEYEWKDNIVISELDMTWNYDIFKTIEEAEFVVFNLDKKIKDKIKTRIVKLSKEIEM